MDILSPWTFWYKDFLERDFSVQWTYRHKVISGHGHFGTLTHLPECLCGNVHIALQGVKISICWNVQVPKYPAPKCPCRQNDPEPKSPSVKMSILHSRTGATTAVPKCPYYFERCQNIHVLKCSCAEISHAERSMAPKCPWAKNSLGQNAHGDKVSMCRCGRRAKTYSRRNVLVMKCPSWNVSCLNVRCGDGGKLYLWPPSPWGITSQGNFFELTRLFFLATYKKGS